MVFLSAVVFPVMIGAYYNRPELRSIRRML